MIDTDIKEPNEKLVSRLESFLELAKSGELINFLGAGQTRDGDVRGMYVCGEGNICKVMKAVETEYSLASMWLLIRSSTSPKRYNEPT